MVSQARQGVERVYLKRHVRAWDGHRLAWVAGALLLSVGTASRGAPSAPSATPRSFEVKVESNVATRGAPAKAVVRIQPGKGYHLNLEFPTSLTLTPPAGVQLTKPKVTLADKEQVRLTEQGGELEVRFVATEGGSKVFDGDLKFAVCSATTCDPQREKVHFTVEVK